MSSLRVTKVSRSYGGVQALVDVSLSLEAGGVQGLIGPNGAGKTTLINVITGFIRPHAGSIRLGDAELTKLPPWRIGALGVARTFQTPQLIHDADVRTNIAIGLHRLGRSGMWDSLFRTRRQRKEELDVFERVRRVIKAFGLADVADASVAMLPAGVQRRVEFARVLVSSPTIVLLDEPAAGLSSGEEEFVDLLVERLRFDGSAVMLIEHKMSLVMRMCDNITVLDRGRVIAEGSPNAIQSDPSVLTAYLGE